MNIKYLCQELSAIQAHLQVLVIASESGNPSRNWPGAVRNIYKRLDEARLLSQALTQEWEHDQERLRRKSIFLQALSHEAQESWMLILSTTNLLEHHANTQNEASRQECFWRIRAAGQNFNRLIEELLILNEGQSSLPGFQPSPLELLSFFNAIQKDEEFFTQQNRINLIQIGIPQLTYLDASQVRGIFKSLLSNALKFSEQQVEVRLIWHPDTVNLIFCDHGIGIPSREQDQVFLPFYRATNTQATSGLGIGLSVVKRAVELHNGRVTIRSNLGQGTSVIVTLPIQVDLAPPSMAPTLKTFQGSSR